MGNETKDVFFNREIVVDHTHYKAMYIIGQSRLLAWDVSE